MNILYLTYSYLPTLGGVQRSVYNLATEFTRRGYRIVIAADGRWPFTFQRLQPATVFSFRIPYPFRQERRKEVIAALLDVVNIPALTILCLWYRIGLIHCHLINVDTRYALTMKKLLGVKLIITLRGGEFHHWIAERPQRQQHVRELLESADAVTALSQSQMDDAKALAPGMKGETRILRNPADPEAIRRKATAGRAAGAPASYILFSGRLEAQKRVDLLIDAYHRIVAADRCYPHDVLIAGDGSLLDECEEQARRGAGAGRIHFAGSFAYGDSLALIRDAAMLVLPSQESEGCPNVVLEAMALGTPVIVSDHGPLPELVTAGVSGEVFPSGDAEALRDRLLALTGDPEKRARYAAAGLEVLDRQHRFDRIADAYEELYRQLASPRTSAKSPR